jgi:predicted transcriptional regulator
LSLYVKPINGNGKGSNRHNLEIVRDMLAVASVKARKTRIMYQANLSFVQVEKYLHDLLEKGLLNHDGDSCYLITEKGLGFLKLYEEYAERCKKLREQVNQSMRDRMVLEQMCTNRDHDYSTKLTRRVTFPHLEQGRVR